MARQGKSRLLSTWRLQELYAKWGCSRQAYHQWLKRQQLRLLQEDLILELVLEQKRLLPHSGGRKMLHLITPHLQGMGIDIGRDCFFDLLRKHDLLVKTKKRRVVTTQSKHPFKVYGNLVQGLTVQRILQVWVTDITYIRTLEGFVYLALLTDSFSRKILGWDLSDALELEGCLRALKMALKPLPKDWQQHYPCIHHSDRGSQYCAYAYTDLLKQHQLQISMAAAGNCYENAQAERINGILKTEFELHQTFNAKSSARAAVKDAIDKYNHLRPHCCLQLQTPAAVFDSNFKELFV